MEFTMARKVYTGCQGVLVRHDAGCVERRQESYLSALLKYLKLALSLGVPASSA